MSRKYSINEKKSLMVSQACTSSSTVTATRNNLYGNARTGQILTIVIANLSALLIETKKEFLKKMFIIGKNLSFVVWIHLEARKLSHESICLIISRVFVVPYDVDQIDMLTSAGCRVLDLVLTRA